MPAVLTKLTFGRLYAPGLIHTISEAVALIRITVPDTFLILDRVEKNDSFNTFRKFDELSRPKNLQKQQT